LCYNPSLSLPSTLSVPSYPCFPSVFTSPSYPTSTFHDTTPPSYTLTICWLTYSTNHIHPKPLQSLIQSPSTITM
jgi:hypothetical protein